MLGLVVSRLVRVRGITVFVTLLLWAGVGRLHKWLRILRMRAL